MNFRLLNVCVPYVFPVKFHLRFTVLVPRSPLSRRLEVLRLRLSHFLEGSREVAADAQDVRHVLQRMEHEWNITLW